MEYYLDAWRKYAMFSGRATRSEYWYFCLFNLLVYLTIIAVISLAESSFRIIVFLYFAAVFIPALSVSVRRLHDIGKSGWMFFIQFIPLIGDIWFFILMVTASNPGSNKYEKV